MKKSELNNLGLDEKDPFFKAWTIVQDKLASMLKN